jgi:hypothetical protein
MSHSKAFTSIHFLIRQCNNYIIDDDNNKLIVALYPCFLTFDMLYITSISTETEGKIHGDICKKRRDGDAPMTKPSC